MRELLFVYGTLHPERAPKEIADTVRTLTPVSSGTLEGTLLDLGEYPGVLLPDQTSHAPTFVRGHVFALPEDALAAEETWSAMDAYEDFRAHDLAGSLFVRRKAFVTLEDGSRCETWVYTWNGGT